VPARPLLVVPRWAQGWAALHFVLLIPAVFVALYFDVVTHATLETHALGGAWLEAGGNTTATLLVRTPRGGDAAVEIRQAGGNGAWRSVSVPAGTRDTDFTSLVRIDGLEQASIFDYRVVRGRKTTAEAQFTTPPERGAPFRFAFGSCAFKTCFFSSCELAGFGRLTRHDPAFLLFIGDLIYGPPPTTSRLRARDPRCRPLTHVARRSRRAAVPRRGPVPPLQQIPSAACRPARR